MEEEITEIEQEGKEEEGEVMEEEKEKPPVRKISINMNDLADHDLGIYNDDEDGPDLTDTEDEDAKDDGEEGKEKTTGAEAESNIKDDAEDAVGAEDKKVQENMQSMNITQDTEPDFDSKKFEVEISKKVEEDDFDAVFPEAPGDGSLHDNNDNSADDESAIMHSALRATTNTPADVWDEVQQSEARQSRATTSCAPHFRERYYNRAMSLMTTRCSTSQRRRVKTPLLSIKNPPSGSPVYAKVFYVEQNRPSPMEPLKAWRGYNGNVYFEPIGISATKPVPKSRKTPSLDNCSDILRKAMQSRASSRLSQGQRDSESDEGKTNPMTPSQKSKGSKYGHLYVGPTCAVLDKNSVLNRYNATLPEEVALLASMESTGSLKVDEPGILEQHKDHILKKKYVQKRDKICKGSVAHRIYLEKRNLPDVEYSGYHSNAHTHPSQNLRAQTAHSGSSLRLPSRNSPEGYHAFIPSQELQLPPLDHLQATLRHYDGAPNNLVHVRVPAFDRPNMRNSSVKSAYKGYVKFA
ncbi:uncharacterized protein LOC106173686 isoform X2 [Lingula anatina]|nr:uncharacterized protein LOC106173686 isoform X2 [Lingula anatina]XP_013410344.1 uncharacterized protein LOC106173686 isoform X2 [Lingula anatina]XP_013410345.1 uncharacterized protein LOC106173686 isoform X2 [Lingula anatina]XP_013410346.1 uncharacterized protein LOC106173686 isoform X2 [Lingula anatina]XP_013410347.1 uncharacterized protein LOC106173686 isoform X2 [Lingula anatina]|eukprot:XP_013410343.1 uncharacterized protein LOC106173686 isoform X2 [Lingula anatina]